MKENLIKARTFAFALDVVKVYKLLTTDQREYVLSKQLLRCGTSIGAMVSESEHAQSKADFIHKLAIAQKEANETDYWLKLFITFRLPE
ncbi:MAG TPA: four helix bundle protein [Flavobacterium sp.]|jgi:four helix bundle protein|nr:four helix bundle protein [Flavobacterium sp.]